MIKKDEHALICDLAETYNIYNYKKLPLSLVSTLASGLSPDSRIMRKFSESILPTDLMLLAGISDKLSMFIWMFSEDGRKNRNRPKLILQELNEKKNNNIQSYNSSKDFEKARLRLIRRTNYGN